jgi:hypothetical protein
MKVLIFPAGCVFLAMITLAQAEKRFPTVIGPGANSCGTWTSTIGIPAHLQYEGWVLGYVSAYNFYVLSIDTDVSRTTDARGILGWIDGYCVTHPLNQNLHRCDYAGRRTPAQKRRALIVKLGHYLYST